MFSAFITGFFLGLSLIVAIGAQNAFVIRQGILRQHIFYTALFCSISDALLIIVGIAGISYFLNDLFFEYSKIIYGISAIWLFAYGFMRIQSAFKSKSMELSNDLKPKSLLSSISIIAALTYLNPHVYLDTVILIGSVSQQFIEINRIYFAVGACSASFVWFFGIAYGAKLLSSIMQTSSHWRILETFIAFIMFTIGFNILSQGGWI